MNIFKDLVRGIQKKTNDMIKKSLARFIITVKIEDVTNRNNQLFITGTEINKGRKINDIKFSGINLGNGKGIIFYPKNNDIILVLNLFGEYIYLNSLYDTYTGTPDNQIQVKSGELYIVSKSFGSYIKFKDNDDLVLHTNTGAKFKISKSGSFKLYNKDGYGIDCTINGDVTIRDQSGTATTTSSPGTF